MRKLSAHKKRKPFVIDKIYDDSFYGNLFLGLSEFLRGAQAVTDIKLERRPAATNDQVNAWQQINDIILPPDLRDLYESSDGISLSYRFHYYHDDTEAVACGIHINSLSELQPFNNSETTFSTPNGMQCLAPHCKVFTLASIDPQHRVVLAKFLPTLPTTIWVYLEGRSFISLCPDVTTYLKMALAHLGVPCWQLTRVSGAYSEWTAEILHLLAPGVLERTRHCSGNVMNAIDPKIFVFDEKEVVEGDEEEEEDSQEEQVPETKQIASITQLFCKKVFKK